MRTNNKHVKNVIISVYFILIVFAILLATVFRAFSTLTESSLLTFSLIVLGFAVLFFLVHFISKYFEYDSDGLKVKITNKGLLLSDYFNYREKTIEFEKAHLVAFKYQDYLIYKTLIIVVKPSKGAPKKSVFNVTLVSRKKRKYIKQSLSKMIKHNQNHKKSL